MKKFISHSLLGLSLSLPLAASAITSTVAKDGWWENPLVVGVNKEKAHATQTPYPSVSALTADSEFFSHPWVDTKSEFVRSLNGTWKFNYVASPDLRPTEFYKAGFDASSWDDIPVPSCWAMQGYDTPMYVNVDTPFNLNDAPKIVARGDNDGYDPNPVGSYVRQFTVPANWADKQIFINFEGIYSAAYVWLNGSFVGYTQASNTNHEFDVTPYVKSGQNNTLAVQVIKWSDGSFLENQDMFRWGGIHRDVTIYAVPKLFIRDHYITWATSAEQDYTSGTLNVQIELDNRTNRPQSATAEVTLLGPDGTKVATLPSKSVSFLQAGDKTTVNTSVDLSDVKLWSTEQPTLYTLLLSLKNADGEETEAIATKYGFRHIEQVGLFVHINGQKMYFKGVNRQDTHPLTGRTMDTASLLKDVKLLKQFNINTIRTSHCPHQQKMMAMYDHFGIWVMDEADLETHAANWKFVEDPDWTSAYVDRQERMVLRDRNHPCVTFWSLGNESRDGSNIGACYDAVRALDPRMIHYEGQQSDGFPHSDFTSKMYPYEGELWGMDNWNETRPHFVCEYAHSMGQSLGNFQEYWDFFESSKRTVGGCIWDFADQAIYHPKEIAAGTYTPGRYYTGYDFPGPHQGNFMSNGIVDPERNVSAKLQEVKKVHQWIKFTGLNTRTQKVTVKNDYSYIDFSDFEIHWTLSKDGSDVESGIISDVNAQPGKSVTFKVPYTPISDDAEYLLSVEFRTRYASDWADAGHVVACEQLTVQERKGLEAIDATAFSPVLVTTGNGPIQVAGPDFAYLFDANGQLISMRFKGHEYIYNGDGLKFDDFRWIENDSPYNGNPPSNTSPTKLASKGVVCNFVEGDASGAKAVKITVKQENDGAVSLISRYTIYADGTIDLNNTYNLTSSSKTNRLGMSLSLAPGMENLEYFARGPWSNYIDRKRSTNAAIYTSTVTDEHEPFVKPQSGANHEDMRYLKLTSKQDPAFGLLIESDGQCSFSATHFSDADLAAARHEFELTPRQETILHLDYQQMGLGNGSCGSDVWSRFRLPSGQTLSHTLRFTPLASKSAGYAIPEGTLGAYISELKAGDYAYTASHAPSQLYQFITNPIEITIGQPMAINVGTSKAANVSAWIDTDLNQDFAAGEALSGMTLLLPEATTPGQYRLRIVVDSANPRAFGPVTSGSVYDFIINAVKKSASEPADYITPDGFLHDKRKAYVETISTQGAVENIDYTASRCPNGVYTLLDQTVTAQAGSTITLNLKANEAGPRSTDKSYQDLRYNVAGIFADFNNSGEFVQVGEYGSHFSGANTLANYDKVMNISHALTIPSNASIGHGRIRVIYSNAWKNYPTANEQNIYEGVAYDIPLEITPMTVSDEPTDIQATFFEVPEGDIHPDGNAWVRRIYTTGAEVNVDCSWSGIETFYNLLDQTLVVKPGNDIVLRSLANNLKKRGQVMQDLRYNTCTIFADFEGIGLFERIMRIGDKLNGENVVANYDKVMTITEHIAVPKTATPANGTIRIIYNNAWMPEPSATSKEIIDGCAYDIPVRIVGSDWTELDELNATPTNEDIYDLQGHRIRRITRPGLYIINGKVIKK